MPSVLCFASAGRNDATNGSQSDAAILVLFIHDDMLHITPQNAGGLCGPVTVWLDHQQIWPNPEENCIARRLLCHGSAELMEFLVMFLLSNFASDVSLKIQLDKIM